MAEVLDRDQTPREAVTVLRYEDLCEKPEETMQELMDHCRLEADEKVIAEYSGKIKPPGYYRADFAAVAEISEEVDETGSQFGYRTSPSSLRQSL